mgnify:CR=1 FL=1
MIKLPEQFQPEEFEFWEKLVFIKRCIEFKTGSNAEWFSELLILSSILNIVKAVYKLSEFSLLH